jgi:hypothetical protein
MNRIIVSLVLIFCWLQTSAQTPPEKTWYYNDRGAKTTVKERWAEDNQGLKHGTYIKYFSDGTREILGYYNHDKRSGQWEITSVYSVFLSNYKYIEYVNYLNDEPHGLYKKVAVSDGNVVVMQGNFNNGVETGYWKEGYDNQEKVYSEGNYINGKKEGEWKNTFWLPDSKTKLLEVKETKKGYRTIFKNGEIVSVYDDKGVNLIEKQKQEELNTLIEQEFNNCATLSDYEKFRKKYPNSEFDSDAIVQINRLKKEEQQLAIVKKKEEEYLNPLIEKWKALPDTSLTFSFFNDYYKQFPDGYRKTEVHEMLEAEKQKIYAFMDELHQKYENENKDILIIPDKIRSEQAQYNKIYLDKTTDNIGAYDELFQRYPKVEFPKLDEWLKERVINKRSQYKYQIDYLINLNTERSLKLALAMLNVICRYSFDLHNSSYLPFQIQQFLLTWRFGNVDSILKEIESHKNDVIEYSDGNVKYSKKFKEMYKEYKLEYPNEKEVWKNISTILNL